MAALTLSQLKDVWQKLLKDPSARRALNRLKKDGFAIAQLTPRDPTFKQPSWADYIAALPFLPNRSSRRHVHHHRTLRKYLPQLQPEVREDSNGNNERG